MDFFSGFKTWIFNSNTVLKSHDSLGKVTEKRVGKVRSCSCWGFFIGNYLVILSYDDSGCCRKVVKTGEGFTDSSPMMFFVFVFLGWGGRRGGGNKEVKKLPEQSKQT